MHLPADTAVVGRDREQAELAAALTSARAGHGRAVLLLGEAGMGKSRFAGDPAERARKAVTMRIRAAISTIAAQDDTLARHLRNTIRTGRLCSYQPEEAVSWRT